MKKSLLGIATACLLAGVVHAEEPVKVKANAPEKYTVVQGDTLWGIAGRYLNDPWRWPEIWESNKQVYNPHLIFPGDVLLLCRIQDRTVVAMDQGGGCSEVASRIAGGGGLPSTTTLPNGTVKLHPQVRDMPLSLAIPAIPLKDIQRYLNESRVVSAELLARAPYVLSGTQDRVVAGAGDNVFVRNKNNLLRADSPYGVYRTGVVYKDPDSGEPLGLEAEDIGAGQLVSLDGQVGTLKVNRTTQEVRIGDLLLENESSQVASLFHPSNPDKVKNGKIIRVFGSIASASQYSVIVLNRGKNDGVVPGNTFALWRAGGVIHDQVSSDAVQLPAEQSGMAMVFRTFDRVSYALVLSSNKALHVGDEVRPPISND
ncbi:MAG TPA: LysM peptidoglycan-binding domain-containing protein [Moraxellaceae bacterium]|nr:LysM peptidoglycan-binding domain-containing protein [Moraxellaceae bacterium]